MNHSSSAFLIILSIFFVSACGGSGNSPDTSDGVSTSDDSSVLPTFDESTDLANLPSDQRIISSELTENLSLIHI